MAALPQKPADSSRALGAGLTFAVTVALFAFGGSWLDTKLSTGPWLVLGCTLLGVVGGAIHLITELAPGSLGLSRRAPRQTLNIPTELSTPKPGSLPPVSPRSADLSPRSADLPSPNPKPAKPPTPAP